MPISVYAVASAASSSDPSSDSVISSARASSSWTVSRGIDAYAQRVVAQSGSGVNPLVPDFTRELDRRE